ncbi:MAG: CRISPR-associated helicase Cas3' [Bacteroidetes bacterium]|nr:CRISPR-associated helicase Cas3' [Bacteroidota bacterium]
MLVFSHSKELANGERKGSKLLINHLVGVREKAFSSYSQNTNFKSLDDKKLLNAICWLHDLGKYTSYFQDYLLGIKSVDIYLKTHSNIGAQTIYNHFENDPELAILGYYLVKLHHSNLLNIEKVIRPDDKQYRIAESQNLPKQVAVLNDLSELREHFAFDLANIKDTPYIQQKAIFKKHLKGKTSIEHYFIVNYLFSLLIEADKLDASDTAPYHRVQINPNSVDDRPSFGKPELPKQPLLQCSQNELRNYVRNQVVTQLERNDILERRIFTLAAPTGIGKTMSSLDFALKLRAKIEKSEGHLPQIIYGLPFINIIEQGLSEYQKTLREGKILAHYQYADVFGRDPKSYESINDSQKDYPQKRMAWDTWQSDVVITSFVQLFETLVGNRNKLLKKFHHLADSIIILDEVQTLALEKLPVIGAALLYLTKFMNARVLIMTATQPKIFELMQRELDISFESEMQKPLALLDNASEVFACFNRTKIVPHIADKVNNESFVELFFKYWDDSKSCLVVVNKVSRSIEIFDLLKEKLKDSKVEFHYLSTNITPYERKARISQIKESLKTQTCILVSTQVVEAGVDLDFDMGFRDLGPIDSMVQVAGRVNRENDTDRMGASLHIIDFGDCFKIYGSATYQKAKYALLLNEEVFEKDYLSLVETYFDNLSDNSITSFELSKGVFDAMKNLRYSRSEDQKPEIKSVSDFKIIEESNNGVSIFVEQENDHEGTAARKGFEALRKDEITKADFDLKFKRAFHQRIIAVPSYLYLVGELQKENSQLSENILWIHPGLSFEYYNQETGFNRDNETSNSAIQF